MAWEPATAIRPADAPSEKNRSRREGTWKECTTRTDTRRRVSGFSTVVMSTPGELTEWKNHTKAARAPAATATMTHPDGLANGSRYEKTMPAVTSTEAATAVVSDTSANEAQAAIDTRTAPRQAARSRMECSGGPGLFARRIASSTLMVARCGRRPACRHRHGPPRAPAGGPHFDDRRRVPPRDRQARRCRGGPGAPVASRCTTVPSARSATRSASSGSSGSSTVTVTASAEGRSSSRTINLPACAVARQCTRRRLSPGAYGRAPRGKPASVRGRSATSPTSSRGLVRGRSGRPQRGETWSSAGSGSCTRRVHHCSANGAAEAMSTVTRSYTPRCTGTSVMRSPTERFRPTGPTKTSGPGGSIARTRTRVPDSTRMSTGNPAMASAGAARTSTLARVTTTHGPTIPMQSVPKTRSPRSCTHPAPALCATSHHSAMIITATAIGATGRAGRAQRLTASAMASPEGAPGSLRPIARSPHRPRP